MLRIAPLLLLVSGSCLPLPSERPSPVSAPGPTGCGQRFGELLAPVLQAFHSVDDDRVLLIDPETLEALGTIYCAEPVDAEHLTANFRREFRPVLYRDISRSLADRQVHVRLTSVVDLGDRIEVVGYRMQRRSADRFDFTQMRVHLGRERGRYKVLRVEVLLET